MTFPNFLIPATPCTARGRLAPSPTGLLHLGNAWAFWAAWASARAARGEMVLRIEDIDPARSKPAYVDTLIDDLAWLGIDWDFGPAVSESDAFYQSRRFSAYEEALRFLGEMGLAYPCYCTRKELREIAGAPHVDDIGVPYPGTCRSLRPEERERYEREGRKCSIRLVCPPEKVWGFTDLVMGPQNMTLEACGGDFALRRSDGVYAYQLAVVVDDMAMGVTEIVRGSDILASTPRQLYLYSLFGGGRPVYAHVPLVVDNEGQRLAKRHSSLTLRSLREAGVRAETILGWFMVSAGVRPEFSPVYGKESLAGFSFKKICATSLRLPPDPVAHFLQMQK